MAAKRHRLAQRRKTVGFTQEALAEQLGVDSTTVRRWESGETENGPQPWIRPKLAHCLQVSVEQLAELLQETIADGSQGVDDAGDADAAGTGHVGPQRVEPRQPGRPDVFTEGAATSAEAQRQEVALSRAYAEDRTCAQELRAGAVPPDAENGNGWAPPTGQEVLGNLISAVGAELAGSLAGPLLFLVLLSTPGQAVSRDGEWREQLQEQLRTFLHEWANTMERREHLRLLGRLATAVAASPILGLDHEEQERPTRVIAAPNMVDERSIDHLEAILQHCQQQEDTFGPQAVLHTVIAQREFVDSLLGECPEELRSRLLSVYSSMSTSIGVYFFDLDDVASAMRYCKQARAAAQEARNTELAIHALSTMAFFSSWQGKAHTAIDSAAAAQSLATKTDDHLLRGRTAAEFGMAYAVDGQYRECMAECDRAYRALASDTALSAGQRSSAKSPVYWLHEGLIASHQSDCLLRLGKPAEAAAVAERGLQLFDSSFVSGLAFCNLRLGTARLLSGEVEDAAWVIGEGALLATRHHSTRLTSEVRAVRKRLQPWHNTPAVRELDERLRAYGMVGI